jgi:amino acid adenylation domain-containing protein
MPQILSEKIQLHESQSELLDLLLMEEGFAVATDNRIRRRNSDGRAPASHAQRRLWMLDRIEGGAHYNECLRIDLKGPLDLGMLEQALNKIFQRHEALRTNFSSEDGRLWQNVSFATLNLLPVMDLGSLPENERMCEFEKIAAEEGARRFDMLHDPLWRTRLIRLAEQEHILLIVAHHIATDGWSFDLFMRELIELCSAGVKHTQPALPELAVQYADYSEWQREWLSGKNLDQLHDYWRQRLSGAAMVLELPADHTRPKQPGFKGARLPLQIDAPLAAGLRELSQREECTLFITLLSAFAALLFRHTRQTDIIIGTPTANRGQPGIEKLIGVFMNTLPLRMDLSGNPSFRDLLARTRASSLEAYAHAELPFDQIVEAVQPRRDTSRTPVFQVMFSHQNTPLPAAKADGLSLSASEYHNGSAKVDLALTVSESARGLEGWIEYATDLFNQDSIERLAIQFQTLLKGIVADPNQNIERLPLLREEDRRLLLEDCNATAAEYPQDRCAHELFELQAARVPNRIAAQFMDQQLTYAELDARANLLAARLLEQGAGANTIIGIASERSLEMLVAMLGVMKSGAAYLPIDTGLPKERVAQMLEDARPRVILGHKKLLAKLPPHQTAVLALDDDAPQNSAALPISTARTSADNTAYVLYTSGSTGKPNGVQVPHRALVNFLLSMRSTPGMDESDVILGLTTLSFDIAELELLLPLCTGARVVIAGRELAMDANLLAAEIDLRNISIMQATPATWRMLLDSGWTGRKSLKMLCGGEALSRELAGRLLKAGGSLWNMYGPTETTVWSAACRVQSGTGPVFFGGPIANTRLYVLDAHLQPQPIGVPGELYIGGAGVAKGYLNRPELNAARFMPDPFASGAEKRMYKTGDVVRRRADGMLEFLGRTDHQVKIRGYRIELAEIESAVKKHPTVGDAVVVVREFSAGEKRLVAYIIPKAGQIPSTHIMRDFLKTRLPEYMLPNLFEFLKSLPLTPSGKVDRKALPAPRDGHPDAGIRVEPRTAFEKVLCEIWAGVLKIPQVGINDNFFDLGGHSVLAMQLIGRISEDLQLKEEIPVRHIFETQSLAEFAEAVLRDSPQHKQIEKAAELSVILSTLTSAEISSLLRQKNSQP